MQQDYDNVDDDSFYDSTLNDILIRYKELNATKEFLEYNGNFDNNKRFFLIDNVEQEMILIEKEINDLKVN